MNGMKGFENTFSMQICQLKSIPETRKKGGSNGVVSRFQQLRSYRYEIEIRNQEEIFYSKQIVPRGLSVAEGP